MDWLARLFEHTEGAVELRAFPNARDGGRAPSIFTRDAEDVARFAGSWDRPGYGVYFGACTRRADSTPPGRLETVAECPALWIDKDDDKNVGLLTGCYLPASVVVDSGRGLHGWWLLDEAVDVTNGRGNPVVDALRELRRVFASDPHVCELARVMRLPGTHNSKGDGGPRPVRILHDSGRRYSFDDIKDWLAWQQPLSGERPDPFLAAAERLGVKPAFDVEQALASMAPGNIHERQLRVSASLVTAGKSEDDIVAVLLPATRLAAGQEGARWNWRKEEDAIRQMVRTGRKKFEVVDLGERRRKTMNGGETGEATVTGDKEPAAGRVARVALEAWGRPIIIVDGEPWTYQGGVWEPLEGGLLRYLEAHVHRAGETIGKTSSSSLNGAMRWIIEDVDRFRFDVAWDRAGVVVGDNGALEIETGRVVPHSPGHYATRRVGCGIDAAAGCPAWLRFLAEALPEDSRRCVETLQEWVGAALVRGKPRELSKGLLAYGPSRTGKTQVAEVVRALLGGGTCGLRVRALSERFGMQPLVHASGWIADDAVGQHEIMDAEAYKLVVTGESVSVERKNQTSVEVRFDLPVLLTMNAFPRVKDSSEAVYNRTLVLPMKVVRAERDATPVAEKVAADELPGVLNWALAGWHRLKARGFYDPPPPMLAAGRDFQGENNPLQEFAELCVRANPDRMVLREDFRVAFNEWLKREVQARSEWSGKAVALAVQNGLPVVVGDKVHAGRVWVGIEFTSAVLPYLDQGFGETKRDLASINMGLPAELRERHRPKPRTVF